MQGHFPLDKSIVPWIESLITMQCVLFCPCVGYWQFWKIKKVWLFFHYKSSIVILSIYICTLFYVFCKGALCMRFVSNFWWFLVVLEYSLSTVLVFSPSYNPEVEISCRSCKPFKTTYKSFASLNRVQIWNLSSKTSSTTFTRCKRPCNRIL